MTPEEIQEVIEVMEPRVRYRVLQELQQEIAENPSMPLQAIVEKMLADQLVEENNPMNAAAKADPDCNDDGTKKGRPPEFAAMSLGGVPLEQLVKLRAGAQASGDRRLRMSCASEIQRRDDEQLAEELARPRGYFKQRTRETV